MQFVIVEPLRILAAILQLLILVLLLIILLRLVYLAIKKSGPFMDPPKRLREKKKAKVA